VSRCSSRRLQVCGVFDLAGTEKLSSRTVVYLASLFCAVVFSASGAELNLSSRIVERTFPSVFQAWNGATPVYTNGADAMLTMHDLAFVSPSAFGLQWEAACEGEATAFRPEGIGPARGRRAKLLVQNPHLVLLAEVRYRDAPKGFLPDASPYWKRDAQGACVMGWEEGGYRLLDVASAAWHVQVAQRAKAIIASGVFDGVMLDWWTDDDARLALVRQVRQAIGPNALILVNGNDRTIPRAATFVNGVFMECYRSATTADWLRIGDTLRWAEKHLRSPRINCVETWWHQSRQDMHLMRAVTTLALTQSDGYCLFSDPNSLPTPDHQHDWYAFWAKGLGRPQGPGVERPDRAWERSFTRGKVLYNPPGGSSVIVRFQSQHRSRASGRSSQEHAVPSGDGDIFVQE